MFVLPQRFPKEAAGTEVVILTKGAGPATDRMSKSRLAELSMAVCVDDIAGAETWSLAVMLLGSQEFKTLATGLAKTTLYQIPIELAVQQIKVTLSGAVACTVVLSARALSSRNYG